MYLGSSTVGTIKLNYCIEKRMGLHGMKNHFGKGPSQPYF